MKRKDFLKVGGMLAAASVANASPYSRGFISRLGNERKKVNFLGEGLNLSPSEYSNILLKMAEEERIKPDNYSNGGIVEELENKFAKIFGKERAVFFPTGTLANQVALRELCAVAKRVVVQSESHIYNDCGDCVQNLSNLTLIPLGQDSAQFSLQELEDIIKKGESGRVHSPVGVISLESPVRRKLGEVFNFDLIKEISGFASEKNIKMHLDGARVFVECAVYNRNPSDYSPYFDTIYTSLYKCFNAASGAVLLGSHEFCDKLFHTRRMFGGGLPNVWPFAAVALDFIENYIDEFRKAQKSANQLFDYLNSNTSLKVTPIINGTNIYHLETEEGDLSLVVGRLKNSNVILRELRPGSKRMLITINPSLNNASTSDLISVFQNALRGI